MQKKSFKIDNSIYSDDVINQGIIDFEEVAKITYTNETLEIESIDNIDEIFNEFMNYVVGIYNELA